MDLYAPYAQMDQSGKFYQQESRTEQEKEKINDPGLFTNDMIFMCICTLTDKYDVYWQLIALSLI